MNDIFISYATEDRERAKQLAQALEGEGWSVWWDRMIPFGRPFDEVIEENLNAAKCVIVLWSKNSVGSKWVRSEATEADERNVLIPVLLESEVDIPIAFKLLQAANLSDWDANASHPEYSKLVSNIRTLIAGAPSASGAAVKPDVSVPLRVKPAVARRRTARVILGFLVLPSLLAAGAAALLMGWRVPTRIDAELVVQRVAFTLAGADRVPIFEKAIGFRSISVERLSSLRFSAREVEALAGEEGGDAWLPVTLPARAGEFSLSARAGERASMTLENADPSAESAGRLEALSAQTGAEVVVEMTRASTPALTLQLDGQALATSILPVDMFQLSATQVDVQSAVPNIGGGNVVRLRARLAEAEPLLQLQSERQGLVITLTARANSTIELLPRSGAAISSIEFLRQNASGGIETAIAAPGSIKFAEFPSRAAVPVDAHQYLGIGELKEAAITTLRFDPSKPGLQLRLQGVAGSVQTKAGVTPTDLRLTMFDQLWYGTRSAILFSIAVWVFSVSLGGYKLYRELGSVRR